MPEQMLKGKVAVVGAGTKNLGGLISRMLGAEGASVTDGWWITGQTIFANGGYTTR
jgi:hypothetical protein